MTHSSAGNLFPNEREGTEFSNEAVFRRKPRFTSLRGVRREMGALYLDLLNGRVSQKVAGTAGNLLNGIVRALEVEILERRLADLEERVGGSAALRSAARPSSRGVVGHA
jgi:hypothetical protein